MPISTHTFPRRPIIFNSLLAAEAPHVYGGLGVVLFPLLGGAEKNATNTTKWVNLIGAESIAIYNLTIDTDKQSKNDIFKNNMIAWHLLEGALGLSRYLTKEIDQDKSISLLLTSNNGAQLVFNYKF